MTDHPLLLQIPERLYERLKQKAETDARPIEVVALEILNRIYVAEDALSLDDLDSATDDQLREVVQRRLTWSMNRRLRQMDDKTDRGIITTAEKEEYDALIAQVE